MNCSYETLLLPVPALLRPALLVRLAAPQCGAKRGGRGSPEQHRRSRQREQSLLTQGHTLLKK